MLRKMLAIFYLAILLVACRFHQVAAEEAEGNLRDRDLEVTYNQIVCHHEDYAHPIPVADCGPSPSKKKEACEKEIRQCLCQHGIPLKWTGIGCRLGGVALRDGGCQCASYCGYLCPKACNADPLCTYTNGKCQNTETGQGGPMPQCLATTAPSRAPTQSPIECFPGSSRVLTEERGFVAMSELRPGEHVQDLDETGKPVFTPVIMISHLSPNDNTMNVELELDFNSTRVVASPQHLIPVFGNPTSSSKREYYYMSQVRLGDRLTVWDHQSKKSIVSTVTAKREIPVVGQYAPITLSGTLVVDHVLVSCYMNARHETVSLLFGAPVRLWYYLFGPISSDPSYYTEKGVHWFGHIVHHIAESIGFGVEFFTFERST